ARRKCRSSRNWGGGWRATGLHAAPRRPASLNIRPLSSSSSSFSFSSSFPRFSPHHATNSLPDDKLPFQLANSNLLSPLLLEQPPEGCYWLYGVFRKKTALDVREDLMDAQEGKKRQTEGCLKSWN
ncbi:hypothetical protein ALC57_11927, partial [Trachymyrmex cornetzi]